MLDFFSDSIFKFDKNGEVIGQYAIPKFNTVFFEVSTMPRFRPIVKDDKIYFYN